MKLVRHGTLGQEGPGILDAEGNVRDLSGLIEDVGGNALTPGGLDSLRNLDLAALPVVEAKRLGPCVGGIGKIIGVGLNYFDHARETGSEAPDEPVIFLKATSSVNGPDDDIVLPPGARRGDWEVELGVVIGKPGTYISRDDAFGHVAGYCIVNDISERSYQIKRGGGQWAKGKGCDTFCPIGPWLVTPDDIAHVHDLHLWLDVDGVRMQNGSTRDMIFAIDELIHDISQYVSLQSGDVIATGTPAGVGMGKNPRKFLAPGMKMRLGIEGLGFQSQMVVASKVDPA